MDFRILGPLEALQDGVPLSPGGPKHRALLALLLLHANEPVRSRCWSTGCGGNGLRRRPPRLCRSTCHNSGERSDARSCGLDLGATSWSWSPTHSTSCASSGSSQRREGPRPLTRRRSCARRWRSGAGRRWPTSREAAFAQAETARLEELRLATAEELADAELALGQEAELVGELERLVAQHPSP